MVGTPPISDLTLIKLCRGNRPTGRPRPAPRSAGSVLPAGHLRLYLRHPSGPKQESRTSGSWVSARYT